MLEFGPDLEEFIKVNFDRKNIFDNGFLKEMREVSLKDRKFSYIEQIESKFVLLRGLDTCAVYDEQRIKIYKINKMLQYLFIMKIFNMRYNKDGFKIFVYAGILHEIMHSYHLDMFINDKSQDTLNTIIKHSMMVCNGDIELSGKKVSYSDEVKADQLYKKYYSFFPEEIHAFMTSLYFMLNVYTNLKPQNVNVIYDFYAYLILSNVETYIFKDKIYSPINRFYKIINRLDIFYKLDFDKYDLREKFVYGMPLTREELYRVCYPFIVFNDLGEIFLEDEKIARKKWGKNYVER